MKIINLTFIKTTVWVSLASLTLHFFFLTKLLDLLDNCTQSIMRDLLEGVWKYYLRDGDSGFPHWLGFPLGLRAAQKRHKSSRLISVLDQWSKVFHPASQTIQTNLSE